MTDYTPIDCGIYSEYELAIMQQNVLQLTWQDADGTMHIGVCQPLDLRTRQGEEFMLVRDAAGMEREIRLDHIMRYNPI
jgi:Rho-binding antiterminator